MSSSTLLSIGNLICQTGALIGLVSIVIGTLKIWLQEEEESALEKCSTLPLNASVKEVGHSTSLQLMSSTPGDSNFKNKPKQSEWSDTSSHDLDIQPLVSKNEQISDDLRETGETNKDKEFFYATHKIFDFDSVYEQLSLETSNSNQTLCEENSSQLAVKTESLEETLLLPVEINVSIDTMKSIDFNLELQTLSDDGTAYSESVLENVTETVPESLSFSSTRYLVQIDLSHRKLDCLSEAFLDMKHLEILNLSYNCIQELPKYFKNFNLLKQVDVSFNQLVQLGKGVFL
jgi:hypothetical protein